MANAGSGMGPPGNPPNWGGYGPPPNAYGQPGYPQGPYGPGFAPGQGPFPYAPPPPPRTTPGLAVGSVVAGVIGIKCLLLGLAFFPFWALSAAGGIAALIMGLVARKQIRGDPTHFSGDGAATAGIVMGSIIVALTVITMLGALVMCVACGGLSVISNM